MAGALDAQPSRTRDPFGMGRKAGLFDRPPVIYGHRARFGLAFGYWWPLRKAIESCISVDRKFRLPFSPQIHWRDIYGPLIYPPHPWQRPAKLLFRLTYNLQRKHSHPLKPML
ncbi:hypothetical protein CEXT_316311 [Caerostris extrusa]|uniref:Uncharacterized protein n=1 Tax=Caerostris extrusa TaxID=172846 RepID=A0AAV4VNH5_CAEEX|nr:hypothetical protein CEXT_316311 [Caerostris extrusa]